MSTQGQLLAAAIVMVETDPCLLQEEIEAKLEQLFPGMPTYRYYANPAAEAMMRHIRKEQQTRTGVEIDKARLRAKGLPEHLATRHLQLIEPGMIEVDVHEPAEEELAQVKRGSQLLALCATYDLYFAIDPKDGSLMLSRPIVVRGALHQAIQPFKAGILAGLKERVGDGH